MISASHRLDEASIKHYQNRRMAYQLGLTGRAEADAERIKSGWFASARSTLPSHRIPIDQTPPSKTSEPPGRWRTAQLL